MALLGGIAISMYHVSCKPLRIFWDDDTTCATWVPCVLPTTGWIPGFSACSGQHAWHLCRAGCIVISENPQGFATHMVPTTGTESHCPLERFTQMTYVDVSEGGGESDDRDGLGTAKSSSAESVSGSMSSFVPSNGGPPRTASIRARPTSSRITATELEELFQRQQPGEGTHMVASYFPVNSKFNHRPTHSFQSYIWCSPRRCRKLSDTGVVRQNLTTPKIVEQFPSRILSVSNTFLRPFQVPWP